MYECGESWFIEEVEGRVGRPKRDWQPKLVEARSTVDKRGRLVNARHKPVKGDQRDHRDSTWDRNRNLQVSEENGAECFKPDSFEVH